MWKGILCGILKSGKLNDIVISYHITKDTLTIKLRIPEDYKDIIKCIEEGLRNG